MSSDITISATTGFNASTWRMGERPSLPDDLANLKYEGTPYTPDGLTAPGEDFSAELPYTQVFWDSFFEEVFPEVSQKDFDNENSSKTENGGFYRQMFQIAAQDFYDSYFRGRDDLGSNMQGQILNDSTWNSLAPTEQKVIIHKYLKTRAEITHKEFSERMLLNHLDTRKSNVFVWVAKLMISIMGELQGNTINAGRYATRLAQTQTAISSEMSDEKYQYQELRNSADYSRMALNENNGMRLEDLRTFRSQIQKETDRASSFLESSNSGVENMGSTALQFLNKSKQLQNIFFQQV